MLNIISMLLLLWKEQPANMMRLSYRYARSNIRIMTPRLISVYQAQASRQNVRDVGTDFDKRKV